MNEKDPKVTALEQKVQTLENQLRELHRRVDYLERENNRRKAESTQLTQAINRKG